MQVRDLETVLRGSIEENRHNRKTIDELHEDILEADEEANDLKLEIINLQKQISRSKKI